MYEYKVETYMVKEAERKINDWAKKGWKVIAVTPNNGVGVGLVVTYEKSCLK